MDMVDLINNTKEWAKNKGIVSRDNAKQQYIKMVEEVGELGKEVLLGKDIREELGDVIVTTIILAQDFDTDISECLEIAYNKIAKRKGKIINGVFVKENDL